MDQVEYVQVVRRLPPPTIEQSIRFAWFVAGAHSWYKHLPLTEKVPFTFFLDPNSGRSSIHTKTGERAVVDITPESHQFHYTWQTTDAYRRRFGFWNYFAPYGTAFLYASDGGVLHTGNRARILDDNGDWLPVTESVYAGGTAHVNAFVHASLLTRLWWEPAAVRQSLEMFADEGRKWLNKQRHILPAQFREAAESRVRELIPSCVGWRHWFGNGWELFDDEWEPSLRSLGAANRDVEGAFSIVQRRLIEEVSNRFPKDEELDVIAQVNLERHRQLTEMWQAMGRVVAMVYDDRRRTGLLSRLCDRRWIN